MQGTGAGTESSNEESLTNDPAPSIKELSSNTQAQSPGHSLFNRQERIQQAIKAHWNFSFLMFQKYPLVRNLELKLFLWVYLVLFIALGIILVVFHLAIGFLLAFCVCTFLVVTLSIHAIMRFCAPFADPVILPVAYFLNGLSIIMLLRLDYEGLSPVEKYGMNTSYAFKQLIWMSWSSVIMILVLVFFTNHKILQRYTYQIGIIGLIFLLIPAILPAKYSEVNGAKIWILIDTFSFQPDEMTKICVIFFMASFLVAKRELFINTHRNIGSLQFPRLRDSLPLFILSLIALAILVIEKDLGTAMLLYLAILIMIYIATGKISWFVIGIIVFIIGLVICYFSFPDFHLRISLWLHPLRDPEGINSQNTQAIFGLGTGGLAGTGLGLGRPTLVSLSYSDFIISSFGEELGEVGLVAILMLYLILIIRAIHVAVTLRDSYGKLLASGIGTLFFVQIVLVFGSNIGFLPFTGLTTPLLSYGGSSLVATYISLGVLAKLSSQSREPIGINPTMSKIVALSQSEILGRKNP